MTVTVDRTVEEFTAAPRKLLITDRGCCQRPSFGRGAQRTGPIGVDRPHRHARLPLAGLNSQRPQSKSVIPNGRVGPRPGPAARSGHGGLIGGRLVRHDLGGHRPRPARPRGHLGARPGLHVRRVRRPGGPPRGRADGGRRRPGRQGGVLPLQRRRLPGDGVRRVQDRRGSGERELPLHAARADRAAGRRRRRRRGVQRRARGQRGARRPHAPVAAAARPGGGVGARRRAGRARARGPVRRDRSPPGRVRAPAPTSSSCTPAAPPASPRG